MYTSYPGALTKPEWIILKKKYEIQTDVIVELLTHLTNKEINHPQFRDVHINQENIDELEILDENGLHPDLTTTLPDDQVFT